MFPYPALGDQVWNGEASPFLQVIQPLLFLPTLSSLAWHWAQHNIFHKQVVPQSVAKCFNLRGLTLASRPLSFVHSTGPRPLIYVFCVDTGKQQTSFLCTLNRASSSDTCSVWREFSLNVGSTAFQKPRCLSNTIMQGHSQRITNNLNADDRAGLVKQSEDQYTCRVQYKNRNVKHVMSSASCARHYQ